ncbi:MarR family winged helix-turn-helix transcriptional regulator [Spirosoma oryzicola]|uniref:MarR family winged helix-turn-helix transcriptional regulator n=1 Tax=Spirosoma oryzicola TaxID=2898794 RepID=UPI001E3224CB|nr:MarR family transcriptional regulator [Spirosoma oryzicola]UHG93082.1 MarR family transcriptional regulator [Spirosoma oryzicola]
METVEQLKLANQVCFPVYAASRLITKEYQPYLDKLGITYPQYLVLLILWEKDTVPVSEITQKMLLDTNTVTPLLKRMETLGFIERQRSKEDERKVIIRLTQKGKALQADAASIPERLVGSLLSEEIKLNELIHLRDQLQVLIHNLSAKHQAG